MKDLLGIIKEIPLLEGKELSWTPLSGGNVNQSYHIQWEENHCLLRLNGKQSSYLKPSRVQEIEAATKAGELGLSPKVLAATEDFLLTEYIAAPSLPDDQCRDPHPVELYTRALKRIHREIHTTDRTVFSGFDLNDRFLENALRFGAPVPKEFSTIMKQSDRIRGRREDDPAYGKIFCHNDYWQNNLLYDGNKISVIDWELCGYGDVYFDLARIPYLIPFSYEEEKLLLSSYFEQYDEEQWKTLQEMKYIVNVSEAVWAYFHQGLNDSTNQQGFPYGSYATEMVEQLLATQLP